MNSLSHGIIYLYDNMEHQFVQLRQVDGVIEYNILDQSIVLTS